MRRVQKRLEYSASPAADAGLFALALTREGWALAAV